MIEDPNQQTTPTDEKKPAQSVHIDTSLIIEQSKIEKKSRPVRTALNLYPTRSTSSYARKEFKRAWLQDLNLLYKIADGCPTLPDVYLAIRKSTWAAERRLDRCLDAVATHLSPRPELTLSAAVIRLRAYLAEAILGAFEAWERSGLHEFRRTGCVRALERPFRASNGLIDVSVPQCKRTRIQCKVHTFFSENRASFDRIEDEISRVDKPSKELSRTAQMIRAARTDPAHLCDSKNCTNMSDAIIAVDGIQADHLAANNDKEWVTLASALEKPLLNPVRRTLVMPRAKSSSVTEKT